MNAARCSSKMKAVPVVTMLALAACGRTGRTNVLDAAGADAAAEASSTALDAGLDATGDVSDSGEPPSTVLLPQPTGVSIPVPAECQTPADSDPPFTVTIRFRNAGDRAVYRYEGCAAEVEISSCASGYSDELLSTMPFCPCDCDTGVCPTCGGCPPAGAQTIAPGAVFEVTWAGFIHVSTSAGAPASGGRMCWRAAAAAPGRYRATLPIYATAEAATGKTAPVATVSSDFVLPGSGVPIVVDFSAP